MTKNWISRILSLGDNTRLFNEEGVSNYSTMLLREDLNLLVLGAREALYALDLKDISKKVASVRTPSANKAAKANAILEQRPFIVSNRELYKCLIRGFLDEVWVLCQTLCPEFTLWGSTYQSSINPRLNIMLLLRDTHSQLQTLTDDFLLIWSLKNHICAEHLNTGKCILSHNVVLLMLIHTTFILTPHESCSVFIKEKFWRSVTKIAVTPLGEMGSDRSANRRL